MGLLHQLEADRWETQLGDNRRPNEIMWGWQDSKEGERRKGGEIVMDDTTSSIVSYLCGLNALGSWPWSVLVHIIKLHEEEEEGMLELLPSQVHG